ncbi:Uma2 family endonuclease [Actinomadura sp. KC345]|uniref:Uma2 family endonuclease n=1 Tax=Actinomadura sp. KC345 TaxID=2530371 RepID=UPI001405182A|nr:Uma2 family endonuclease [Actinomadura sp. KC345]
MREESHKVKILSKEELSELPDTPYNLWVRGELDDYVDAPEGSRIEIIGGEVVVSPPPGLPHNAVTGDIVLVFNRALGPEFPWRTDNGTGMSLVGVGDGYVPDLMIVDQDVYLAARRSGVRTLVPDQVELVVEVTSYGNAGNDQQPTARGRGNNKWNGYAAAEIPYYLLVDRSPKVGRSILYSIPDQGLAAYLHQESWEFGETVHLPDPFDIEIDTSEWKPWDR